MATTRKRREKYEGEGSRRKEEKKVASDLFMY